MAKWELSPVPVTEHGSLLVQPHVSPAELVNLPVAHSPQQVDLVLVQRADCNRSVHFGDQEIHLQFRYLVEDRANVLQVYQDYLFLLHIVVRILCLRGKNAGICNPHIYWIVLTILCSTRFICLLSTSLSSLHSMQTSSSLLLSLPQMF
jgi:hypothetical protein